MEKYAYYKELSTVKPIQQKECSVRVYNACPLNQIATKTAWQTFAPVMHQIA